jgi:acid phosphatase (class A)
MKRCVSTIMLLLVGSVMTGWGADPFFITMSAVDLPTLLPPPPAADSAEAATELQVVLKLQNTRTEQEVARAKAEADLTPTAFQSVLGSDFTKENFPVLFALLSDAGKDSKIFSTKAKDYFARPRPNRADAHVQPVIEEFDLAYPSGHSTRGTLWACILTEIVPDRKADLVKRGQEIGWDRVLAGVHYPSDVHAGRVLGQSLAQAFLKSADFQTRLTQAKSEFESFQRTHAAHGLEAVGSR